MNAIISTRALGLLALLIVCVQAVVLVLFGQPLICECGYTKLWEGVVLSSGNSQHISDWYTFSHVIHGFIFYLGLWFFFPRLSLSARFLIALGIEVGWEILENTPWLIDHYRQQALAQGYTGDSALNSISDSVAMILGFVAAWRSPVWATIIAGILVELWVGYSIRDNLTLNVLNLIYVFPMVEEWQSGAGG